MTGAGKTREMEEDGGARAKSTQTVVQLNRTCLESLFFGVFIGVSIAMSLSSDETSEAERSPTRLANWRLLLALLGRSIGDCGSSVIFVVPEAVQGSCGRQ